MMLIKQFGQAPTGNRLKKLQASAHYDTKTGTFLNIHETPTLTEGYSMSQVMYNFLFKKHPRVNPSQPIPVIKTDITSLDLIQNLLIWFGHSSYYFQLNGQRFLVDPVFSGNASPIPGSNKPFKGTKIYSAQDMPVIDYLVITHDHYDHLDYPTILQLQSKVKKVICGLGVGQHFLYWGYGLQQLIELDWHQKLNLANLTELYTAPARHFSGRGFKRNNTLWLSFVLTTPSFKLYLGGDSGYDSHFKELGEKFQGFDLALLDNGQYNPAWQAIHMLPHETLQAAHDLKTKRLMPVHNSKFKLSVHPWDEPLQTISALNAAGSQPLPLVTPIIGEIVWLDRPDQPFQHWWEQLE